MNTKQSISPDDSKHLSRRFEASLPAIRSISPGDRRISPGDSGAIAKHLSRRFGLFLRPSRLFLCFSYAVLWSIHGWPWISMLKPKSIITRLGPVCFQCFLDQNDRIFVGVLFQTSKGQNSFIFDEFLVFFLFFFICWYKKKHFFKGQKSEKVLASQQSPAPPRPRYLMVP